MLRLWPEELHIGLFSEHCWLQRGRTGEIHCYRPDPITAARPLLHDLVALLDDPANKIRKGARLSLTVSDSLAAIVILPWQERLCRPAELKRYAQVCFEQAGQAIGTEWILHAQFRHFGAFGMAFGLRCAWLSDAAHLCRERGLQLSRVLPASAAGYYMLKATRAHEQAILLLGEARRNTVLVFNRSGLRGYDIEPVTSAADNSAARLLRRTRARYDAPQILIHWDAFPSGKEKLVNVMTDELPGTKLQALSQGALG